MFFLFCKRVDDAVFHDFPKISGHFPKISEDFQNCSESLTNVSENFPKITEDCRRYPKATEDVSIIHQQILVQLKGQA